MVHLHVHSRHSMLEGVASARQLVARAVEHGMKALALTDTDGLYGAIPFYQAAREAGVKPILGAQLGPCVVLARDREGYAQLCEVVTALRLGKIAAEQLGAWPFPFGLERLFLLTGDRSLLSALHARGFEPVAAIAHYGDGRSFRRADALYRFAHQLGLRSAVAQPIYFLDPEHHPIHRVLAAIRFNTVVDQLSDQETASPACWFRSPEDMEHAYAAWPDALDNTDWIAEECTVELPLGKPRFPTFPLPDGETAFSCLWKQSFEGVQQRYHPLTPAVLERLRYELEIINDLGFAPYFLIVGDIVRFAREHAIPAVGRGSAANSLVAYALGITRVDPFKYNLYFERFLNRARTDCPDIDLDLCWRRRDEVIEYVYRTYGEERVAMICTLNTFQARSAVRETAKAHGLTDREIGRLVRYLPHYGARDIRTAIKQIPECRGIHFDEEPYKSILAIGEFIDGFPRHLSIHAGGLVIAPERLTRFTPLQRAPKGILITQYDMGPIEQLGLVKIDLLGHRSLSVIDDTVRTLRENRRGPFDIERIPDADPRTAELLRTGKTLGCFQIESPAMRGLLQKVHACDIETLVQCVALVRPGASGSGMKQHFIDRHHGREEVVYEHPAMQDVLGDTYGVMIYQEDVIKVAHAVAGMDLTEADALRRVMTKKRGPREMAKHMKRFLEKAQANGVAEDVAQRIWELIANFAAYAYCKAHAATYGELAYQCAYLKTHYPAEFFAAVLSNRGGFYMPPIYLEEAKRLGIEIRLPSINKSNWSYTVENDAIRMGFIEVRNLASNTVEALLAARNKEGLFRSLDDLYQRIRLSQGDAEALFQAGAFDEFGETRPVQYWRLKLRYRPGATGPQPSHTLPVEQQTNLNKQIPDYSNRKRCDIEQEALSCFTRIHPLHYCQAELYERPLIGSNDLPQYKGQHVTLAGWPIAERRVAIRDGRHGAMKFLTLEDTEGVFEAVLFSEAYQAFGHLLTLRGPYLLSGAVQEEHGALALIVDHLETLPQDGLSENTPGGVAAFGTSRL
jgi:DNA-directed DNA polymerase III PolC